MLTGSFKAKPGSVCDEQVHHMSRDDLMQSQVRIIHETWYSNWDLYCSDHWRKLKWRRSDAAAVTIASHEWLNLSEDLTSFFISSKSFLVPPICTLQDALVMLYKGGNVSSTRGQKPGTLHMHFKPERMRDRELREEGIGLPPYGRVWHEKWNGIAIPFFLPRITHFRPKELSFWGDPWHSGRAEQKVKQWYFWVRSSSFLNKSRFEDLLVLWVFVVSK